MMVPMADALSVLEATCKKLTSKVERLRNQLAAAETELEESQTAIRVLSRLGVSASVEEADETKASSQEQVLKILPENQEQAKSPREVHHLLVASGVTTISAVNVRTILSRLRKDEDVPVQSEDGRYWLEPEPSDDDDFEGLVGAPLVRRPVPAFDEDLDSEVPF